MSKSETVTISKGWLIGLRSHMNAASESFAKTGEDKSDSAIRFIGQFSALAGYIESIDYFLDEPDDQDQQKQK